MFLTMLWSTWPFEYLINPGIKQETLWHPSYASFVITDGTDIHQLIANRVPTRWHILPHDLIYLFGQDFPEVCVWFVLLLCLVVVRYHYWYPTKFLHQYSDNYTIFSLWGNQHGSHFQANSIIEDWGTPDETTLSGMSLDLAGNESTSVHVMAYCCQTTSHYLCPFWSRSVMPCGVIRSQWVNCPFSSCGNIFQMKNYCIFSVNMENDIITLSLDTTFNYLQRSWLICFALQRINTHSVISCVFTSNSKQYLEQGHGIKILATTVLDT